MDAGARLYVSRLARKHRKASVQFLDDVGEPEDDGRYVTLQTYCDGQPAVLLVLTVADFYAALNKVNARLLPAFFAERTH